ncbi:30S ribosomal protein S7 [Candidatus Giovannonibacteria bacterium RIFCSPLOWO2_01_FULL_46_13]|uniref:Small ribosomal subunit protein uS7 n=1 Tax=Candidatus Giovannonibacteria bacterium RIFCSPLOWO2_01_FULL_46_13 TaxID=1798352 RepID=A0A1F5X5I3_9BACT|nr:MAG: 30S ribosomal protein S7 [Candidatus Giovannonibacteria bacterium RIFCSPLOWO2_01_FULL_46_13]
MRRPFKKKVERNPDPVYQSDLVEKLTNYIMEDGKKSTARKVVYGAMKILQEKTKSDDALKVVEEAINNASPLLEVRSRRVGGATYQVPREVSPGRKTTLALRWLIAAARSKKGKSMAERLSEELLLASKNEGGAIKKKEDTRKMAEANRAFAHFAW